MNMLLAAKDQHMQYLSLGAYLINFKTVWDNLYSTCLLPCELGPSWQYQIFGREMENPCQNPLARAQFPPKTENVDEKQTVDDQWQMMATSPIYRLMQDSLMFIYMNLYAHMLYRQMCMFSDKKQVHTAYIRCSPKTLWELLKLKGGKGESGFT